MGMKDINDDLAPSWGIDFFSAFCHYSLPSVVELNCFGSCFCG